MKLFYKVAEHESTSFIFVNGSFTKDNFLAGIIFFPWHFTIESLHAIPFRYATPSLAEDGNRILIIPALSISNLKMWFCWNIWFRFAITCKNIAILLRLT